MSAFENYDRFDTLEAYLPLSTSHPSHAEGHYLFDMDSIVHRENEFSGLANRRIYESTRKKFSLGDDGGATENGNEWSRKPIKNWSQEDTINWLMSAASHMAQPYGSIQHSFAVPGKDLILMSRQKFLDNDPVYGDRLYNMLHSRRPSTLFPDFASLNPGTIESENKTAQLSYNNVSDVESENSIEVSTKRQPEKSRASKQKKSSTSHVKLWQFIRDLLRNRETCPSLICWEDYSQGKFRFVRSKEVAKRWGARNGNTNMSYGFFSRAMRYYYDSKIFLPVRRRLVYQFGPNATGWQTDNPNFDR